MNYTIKCLNMNCSFMCIIRDFEFKEAPKMMKSRKAVDPNDYLLRFGGT